RKLHRARSRLRRDRDRQAAGAGPRGRRSGPHRQRERHLHRPADRPPVRRRRLDARRRPHRPAEGPPRERGRRRMKKTLLALVVGLALSSASHARDGRERDFEINTLSTAANTVSGGDVVVEVRALRYARLSDLVVRLNGQDVTAQLSADAAGQRLIGLLTGLQLGKNRVTVSSRHHHGGQHYAKLEITNHPISGEIFGPHQRPWVCETEASGLGAPPASGPCVAATKYEWFYRTTAGAFAPLANPGGPLPADLARTTTSDGSTV